jgi:hypothetical protein
VTLSEHFDEFRRVRAGIGARCGKPLARLAHLGGHLTVAREHGGVAGATPLDPLHSDVGHDRFTNARKKTRRDDAG